MMNLLLHGFWRFFSKEPKTKTNYVEIWDDLEIFDVI